jgi:hypothetical protein
MWAGDKATGDVMVQPGLTSKATMSFEISKMSSRDHPYCGFRRRVGRGGGAKPNEPKRLKAFLIKKIASESWKRTHAG